MIVEELIDALDDRGIGTPKIGRRERKREGAGGARRYYCYNCGYEFISYQQEDDLGDPAYGCERCGSRRVHEVSSIWPILGSFLVVLLGLGAVGFLAYWLYHLIR